MFKENVHVLSDQNKFNNMINESNVDQIVSKDDNLLK